ncbi:MAG TPA: hypothetical protein VMN43_10665 [Aestuariivirgaceae bacterium]|nr:hypothetical protein [Aestuariivirgaceae bacterium]
MTSDTVRAIIREVLAEELRRFRTGRETGSAPRPQLREELVSIASDADLAAFVGRLLDLARDGHCRREIEDKRHVFRLAAGGLAPAPAEPGASPARPVAQAARIEAGMVSERQIDALPPGTTQVIIGASVRLTPLARDRARARGIAVERAS